MPEKTDSNNLLSVKGHVVIVTGGGKGIGRVYCQSLSNLGARVVVADVDAESAQATAVDIRADGGEAVAVHTDVSDAASAEAMAAKAIQTFGRIDGLVNNAGLMSSLPRRPWTEIPVEEWDQVMAVNLRGLFHCCRAVFPQMKAQQKGKIINISSSRVWEGTPNRLHYTTSKAGVIGFTRALAREVGEFNIAVNAITPGLTLSDAQVASTGVGYADAAVSRRAFKRPQMPGDLVGTVVFLLADASGFITGQTINVDGGGHLH